MNCPLCSAKAEEGAAECPSCGAIFAKLRERKERAKKEAAAALAAAEAPAPTIALDPWRLRLAAAGIVVAWMIGFGLYYRISASGTPRVRKPRSFASMTKARVIDHANGKATVVDVHLSPPRARAEAQSEASAEPAPPPGAPAYDPDFDD